jgi:hypothetical protein
MHAHVRTLQARLAPYATHPICKVLLILLPMLYTSRVMVEFIWSTGGWLAALAGLALGTGLVWWLQQRSVPFWPGITLLTYLFFPFQSPELAIIAGIGWVVLTIVPRLDWQGWTVEAAVLLIALALYVLTLAPGIQPADSGEFQLVLAEWGVAHPPGYALYSLLGGIFTHFFPAGTLADRANLFSALAGALTLAVLARTIRQETGSGWAGAIAAGALGAGTTFWTTATQASIRPMTALFTALMLEAALSYRRANREDDHTSRQRALIRFGLAAGFGVTHHASLFFPGGMIALAILAARPRLIREFRQWGSAVAAACLGAAPWLYLIVRGAANAPLAPDNLTTWDGFWQHTLATGFAGDMFYYRALPDVIARLQLTGQVIAFQWHWIILMGTILGGLILLWRDRWLLLALGGPLAVHTFVTATYRAPQTVEYMIPVYVCIAAVAGWLVGELRRWPSGSVLQAAGAAVLCIGIIWTGWPQWISLHLYQQQDPTAEQARTLLTSAPPDSIILANWHQVTPLWYAQTVEQLRPELDVQYVAPAGAEPILDTWTRRIVETTAGDRPTITCTYYPEHFRQTDLAFSAIESCWLAGFPLSESADRPIAASLSNDLMLLEPAEQAYHVPANGWLRLTLDWAIPQAIPHGQITTFIHLIDAEGRVVAQDDQALGAPAADGAEILTQAYILHIPRTLPPGDYQLLSGAYAVTPDGPDPIADAAGETRFAMGTVQVAPANMPPVTAHPMHTGIGDALRLVGYDADFSVLGRARLYLHWQITQPFSEPVTVTVESTSGTGLAQRALAAVDNTGFVTTAYDVPDIEAANGLVIRLEAAGESLAPHGLWQLPIGDAIYLPSMDWDSRYVMIGDVVLTGYAVEAASQVGESTVVKLTMRSTTALTQDLSLQLAHDTAAVQINTTPAAGTIPTLKWGWQSTGVRYPAHPLGSGCRRAGAAVPDPVRRFHRAGLAD